MDDPTYIYYRNNFNRRYGFGLSRRNTEIGVPIKQNWTFPLNLFNNGTVVPPEAVSRLERSASVTEEQRESGESRVGSEVFNLIDTNPNYRGDGTYNPEERKYTPLFFELPEFTSQKSARLTPPAQSRNIPLDLRRQAFI